METVGTGDGWHEADMGKTLGLGDGLSLPAPMKEHPGRLS